VRLLALLAALIVVFSLAGCGDARRHAVGDYIDSVNAIQSDMRVPLARVESSYRRFGRSGTSTKTQSAALWSAVRSLQELHSRLVRLKPPNDAAAMDRDLIRLTATETAFAREVAIFSDYVPRFRRVLAPLAAASADFRTALQRAHGPAAQVVALRTYRTRLGRIVAGLDRLRPPPVLVPLHTRQLGSLRRVAGLAGLLSTALDRQERARIGPLLTEFEDASQATTTLDAQRAQIDAIRAYNRRLFAIRSLAGRIQQERIALNDRLG
jgi:hypothetical protein